MQLFTVRFYNIRTYIYLYNIYKYYIHNNIMFSYTLWIYMLVRFVVLLHYVEDFVKGFDIIVFSTYI